MQSVKMLLESHRTQKKEITSDCLIDLHHKFMTAYGYIPMDEFRKMKIITFFNLIGKINRDIENQNKAYESMGKSKGRR